MAGAERRGERARAQHLGGGRKACGFKQRAIILHPLSKRKIWIWRVVWVAPPPRPRNAPWFSDSANLLIKKPPPLHTLALAGGEERVRPRGISLARSG